MFEDINIAETGPIDYSQTIKNFTIEQYGVRKDLYFKEVFAMLNFVDHIVQTIFETQYNTHTVSYDFSTWNNKEMGIMVYNTVLKRLKREHMISENDDETYYFHHSLDYNSYGMTFNFVHRMRMSEYTQQLICRDGDAGRMSGRSTILADEYIQTLYRKGTVCIEDHFHDYSHGRCGGNRMPDRMLMDKILRRIEFEFPDEVKSLIKANKSELYIKMDLSFKNCNKINYNLYDI